ncbi:hypothetical protein NUW54_g13885 [Trametes sanguinea]|uniref:Uncharacterized protein n=1 Tax=Trametes sanguinea TaxID=158606 RepID=A0ACC1MIT0_9APHY|nr:hypothetical protein NUW54_g13885 [Trametes sanguinea]
MYTHNITRPTNAHTGPASGAGPRSARQQENWIREKRKRTKDHYNTGHICKRMHVVGEREKARIVPLLPASAQASDSSALLLTIVSLSKVAQVAKGKKIERAHRHLRRNPEPEGREPQLQA